MRAISSSVAFACREQSGCSQSMAQGLSVHTMRRDFSAQAGPDWGTKVQGQGTPACILGRHASIWAELNAALLKTPLNLTTRDVAR